MLNQKARLPLPVPFFYGWVVVALAFLATINSAGIRSALPVFIKPLEAEFGWNRTAISWAGGVSLLLFGAGAPVTGWLLDRFGPRKIMLSGLMLLGLGVAGTILMRELWHLIVLWGFVVGIGAAGLSSVLAASVAHRWFVARRGLAVGILNGASSTGQLIFIPLLMVVVVAAGWRVGSLILVAVSLCMMALVGFGMRNEPSDVGLDPYGSEMEGPFGTGQGAPLARSSGSATASSDPVTPTRVGIRHAVRNSTFWRLCGCYFVCGGTANGLIGLHLIPHAIERGIPQVTAAWTVGVMGGMNLVGTLISGSLTDRMDPRKVLALVFALRGASLFILPYVTDFRGLFVFAIIYGLDWFATVPPVVYLTGETFGKQAIGRMYGWIFLSHQIGAFVSAIGAGTIFDLVGRYEPAFLIGGVMGFVAAAVALSIKPHRQMTPT
ncbi:MAG: MFS transporter [Candidatus Binatia bacterium]